MVIKRRKLFELFDFDWKSLFVFFSFVISNGFQSLHSIDIAD